MDYIRNLIPSDFIKSNNEDNKSRTDLLLSFLSLQKYLTDEDCKACLIKIIEIYKFINFSNLLNLYGLVASNTELKQAFILITLDSLLNKDSLDKSTYGKLKEILLDYSRSDLDCDRIIQVYAVLEKIALKFKSFEKIYDNDAVNKKIVEIFIKNKNCGLFYSYFYINCVNGILLESQKNDDVEFADVTHKEFFSVLNTENFEGVKKINRDYFNNLYGNGQGI